LARLLPNIETDMANTLLVAVGLLVGLGLVVAAFRLSISWEARSRAKKRSWLAPPSGKTDVPHDGV
jgi:hypothetical protein